MGKLNFILTSNMKEYCYILECPFEGRFHFGEVTRESSLSSSSIFPHSDTIFGAIIHNAFIHDKDLAQNLLQSFQNDDITMSSGFFYIEHGEKRIFFFPKPTKYDFVLTRSDVDPKKIKKVRMLSWSVIREAYGPEKWFDENVCIELQDGEFICLKSEAEGLKNVRLYQTQVSPKIPILYTAMQYHYTSKDDERKIYYQTDVFLGTDNEIKVGYYFLIKHIESLDEKLVNLLDKSISLISSFGLGGDRSTGGGAINKIEKLPFIWEIHSEAFINLSLLLPESEDYKNGSYRVIKRGGLGIRSHLKQKTILCIQEGGVFSSCIKGKIVEVAERTLKYCKPYWLSINNI